MRPARLSAQEVISVLKRRKLFLIFPFVLVVVICTVGAFLLPREYASSTTILVQRDEITNPLVNFTEAVGQTAEDRLRTFNEITYSKNSVMTVIDSLHLDKAVKTEDERQQLIKDIKRSIVTDRPGAATFRLTFYQTDPVSAWRGVSLLAHYFIRTLLDVENKRNELALEFYQRKLDELREKFESKQAEIVALLRTRIEEMPLENRMLLSNLEDIDKEIGQIDKQLNDFQHASALLLEFSANLSTDRDKQLLFDLQRMDVPHASELHPLVGRFEELTRQYTSKYPEVQKVTAQIIDLLGVIKSGISAESIKIQKMRGELGQRRTQIVDDLKQTTATAEVDKDKRSSFDISRSLYDEMKLKLEQARMSRDLGRTGGEQFVLIDPPLVPTEAARPNRTLIISAGVGLGLLIGLLSAALSELLDPTIRTAGDLSGYRKQIIAYIPEKTAEHLH